MLNVNSHYNFGLYANSILGHSHKNAKLISILNYTTALKFDNVELLHRQVYPYLPPGTPSDNTQYTYYLFEVGDKQLVIASEWIILPSVELTTGVDKVFKLYNITPDKVAIVRDQLRLLGINFDIL